MRKVCIVRRKYYPWQRNVRRDAEALVKAGYEVDVICTGYKGQLKREVMNGVNIFRIILPYYRDNVFLVSYDYCLFFFLTFLKLSWFTLKKRYDVIEINTMPDFLVFITIFSRIMGSKIILYMFEDMPTLFMSSYHVGRRHPGTQILRFFEKWSAAYADHVIVSDGDHYKRTLESRGIPSRKITVILNVPDTEIFASNSIPKEPDRNYFRLVIVSTLVKRYGVQTVIKAIPLITRQIPEVMVDVVGEGEFRPELERMARELKVTEFVNFKGLVTYERVPDIIGQASLGLAPMSDDVGLPNKLFEYFAMGKPAVVSAQPSLISVFGHNGTVAFFKPDNEVELADRILELYQVPEKRASLVSHAYDYYHKHQWSILKYDYLKVYEELLKK
jgi:glycosyltransferase involved in cell wall biosynthesis